eukprot:1482-Heterococcus_DN1.PRE.2
MREAAVCDTRNPAHVVRAFYRMCLQSTHSREKQAASSLSRYRTSRKQDKANRYYFERLKHPDIVYSAWLLVVSDHYAYCTAAVPVVM